MRAVPDEVTRGCRADETPLRLVVPAALLFGLAVVAGLRDGGFWQSDALAVALVSLLVLAAATAVAPVGGRAALVTGSLVACASWWLFRAVTAESLDDFLPFGASILAFAAAFAAVRPLPERTRQGAALAVACVGGGGALIGLAGLVGRWYPMAMPAQGLWRLSTTLTYADAAGLALALCLLLALGTDLHPRLARASVCLCTAGLLATQSRGACVAFACACALVPAHRYLHLAVPLLCGVVLGVAAVASSSHEGAVPWLGVLTVIAVGVAVAAPPRLRLPQPGARGGAVAVVLGLGAVGLAAILLHHEIGLRVLAPSDQDRSVEWSTAVHQWASAPVLGVGPDRPLVFHAPDGTLAHFVHNEYLQVAADSGLVGLTLLGVAAVAVARIIRRIDVLTSCAAAACVCFAVAGGLDFDWHLPVVGLLGGWCAGLAAGRGAEA